MDLSRRCKEYWGFSPDSTPFGTHIEADDGLFLWPAFEAVVDRIETAVRKKHFLVLCGAACSAKSTAWTEAKRRLLSAEVHARFCTPDGLDPSRHRDQAIYHAIKYGIAPPDANNSTPFARYREDRARQARQLLEAENAKGHPVCVWINDAHLCRGEFLLMAKRLWDDLYGFDRLLSIILIGQPGLAQACSAIKEINERAEVVILPGLVSLDRKGGVAESHVSDYLNHELARCGATEFPFGDDAIAALDRLARPNWLETSDHPLIVNNICSRALHLAWQIKQQIVDAELVTRAIRSEAL
jgi:type II secretory pathway predicted ATPase ExeA